MARIEYRINQDPSGNVTVVSTIERLDPGDEILLVTTTGNAALQWIGESPFAPPADGKVFLLPHTDGSPEPLQVLKSVDMSAGVAQCGESDSGGNFRPWKQGQAGFPGVGN